MTDNKSWIQTKSSWIVLVCALPLIAMPIYFATRPEPAITDRGTPVEVDTRARDVEVGGIRRPASDVAESAPARIEQPASKETRRIYMVKSDANADTQSVSKAFEEKRPERLTASIAPAPFDEEKYRESPDEYLHTIEPGRVYKPAQPGDGVKSIEARSNPLTRLVRGEAARLSVMVPPGAPVTFTSFNRGAFDNKLPSITVAADKSGLATAAFTATPTAERRTSVMAASPLASGQVRFAVVVSERVSVSQ